MGEQQKKRKQGSSLEKKMKSYSQGTPR